MSNSLTLSSPSVSAVVTFVRNAVAAVGKVFNTILEFCEDVAETASRQELVKMLNGLTDEELLSLHGIRRDQIIEYVFRDRTWL